MEHARRPRLSYATELGSEKSGANTHAGVSGYLQVRKRPERTNQSKHGRTYHWTRLAIIEEKTYRSFRSTDSADAFDIAISGSQMDGDRRQLGREARLRDQNHRPYSRRIFPKMGFETAWRNSVVWGAQRSDSQESRGRVFHNFRYLGRANVQPAASIKDAVDLLEKKAAETISKFVAATLDAAGRDFIDGRFAGGGGFCTIEYETRQGAPFAFRRERAQSKSSPPLKPDFQTLTACFLQEGGSRTPRRFSIAIMSASLAATDDNNSIPLFRSFEIASAKLFNASVIVHRIRIATFRHRQSRRDKKSSSHIHSTRQPLFGAEGRPANSRSK